MSSALVKVEKNHSLKHKHALNLACEINEPDNKSLHINFYRFSSRPQQKKTPAGRVDFHIVQKTDNQIRIIDTNSVFKKEKKRECFSNGFSICSFQLPTQHSIEYFVFCIVFVERSELYKFDCSTDNSKKSSFRNVSI